MFHWIVSNILQYLEAFTFVDLCETELLELELFDHLTVCIYKMCLQIIYIIYVFKTGFGIK